MEKNYIMQENLPTLLNIAASNGRSFLGLCKVLHNQGVDLASSIESSIPRTCYELQMLLSAHPLLELKQAMNDGTAQKEFPIGTIIPDIWTEFRTKIAYPMPLIVVGYRKIKLANLKERFGAILLRQKASPYKAGFGNNSGFRNSVHRLWHNHASAGDYISGCSADLLRVVAEVIVAGTSVKFFPPSLEELHLDPYNNPQLEELVWEYFRDTPTDPREPCPRRVFLDPWGSARTCWLRDCSAELYRIQWCIDSNGSATDQDATHSQNCIIACAVTAD